MRTPTPGGNAPLPSVPQWNQPPPRSRITFWLALIAVLLAVLIGMVAWLIFAQAAPAAGLMI